MLANADFNTIGNILEGAETILLFPHVNPDGDAMGACVALADTLRNRGKSCWIVPEDGIPRYLSFLGKDLVVSRDQLRDAGQMDETAQDHAAGDVALSLSQTCQPDVCMCIDCCEEKRFPGRADLFRCGKKTLCIDHHQVARCDWDAYYIDPSAAAASELIYELIRSMDWEMSRAAAEALYTGIASDTGSFQYSNTTAKTHRIAADLMAQGIEINPINVHLFQSVDPLVLRVQVAALRQMELLSGGRIAMTRLSSEERRKCGAQPEHAETVIDALRNIEGVEYAAFLKEDKHSVRVSLRAKTVGNVAQIAEHFGGGGHVKAAGCTLQMSLPEAYEQVRTALLQAADVQLGVLPEVSGRKEEDRGGEAGR